MAEQQIIVKRSEEDDHDSHHGGGWKVAYADFMTAMMAFFLLLWILNAADEDKLKGIAEYFTPVLLTEGGGGPNVLNGDLLEASGRLVGGADPAKEPPEFPTFGQEDPLKVFDSRLRYEDSPDVVVEYSDEPAPVEAGAQSESGAAAGMTAEGVDAETATQVAAAAEAQAAQEAALDAVEREIAAAVATRSEFDGLSRNLRIDRTERGLLVQIVDDAGQSMFTSGSARIAPRTRALIEAIGGAIADMPNAVEISGHTDAVPFAN